jgi:hypothetical protein
VRVIKEGKPHEIKVKCTGAGNGKGGCCAILGVVADDIYHTQSSARDESTEYATVCCPACFILTDVDEKKIPGGWKWASKKVETPERILKKVRGEET